MKHLFVLNPVAGGGRKTEEARAEILRVMGKSGLTWELYETTGHLDATRKVAEAAEMGDSLRVYACGGDGTLNECINGAVGKSHVAVTHFPTGTGNDFIKTFNQGRNLFFQLENLLEGREMALDIIDVGGRYGINICSVGLDARIGADVHKYSRLPLLGGKMAYIVSLLANLIWGIAQEFEVEVGGRTFRQKLTLLCACNGRSYGGSFNPVPEAIPDDGQLEILLVDKVSRAGVLGLVKRYAEGRYREIPHLIHHFQEDSLTVRANREFVINIDGEIIRRQEVSFRLLPAGVRFFAPQEAAFSKKDMAQSGEEVKAG